MKVSQSFFGCLFVTRSLGLAQLQIRGCEDPVVCFLTGAAFLLDVVKKPDS